MLLQAAREHLCEAVADLQRRRLPHDVLTALARAVERELAEGFGSTALEPYFIPNDVSLCTDRSVLNFSPTDFELEIPCGFSIDSAARKPTSFARPYYIDPIRGVRRCRGLFALEHYEDRNEWQYDLAFVGHKGFTTPDIASGPEAVLADRLNTRYVFLQRFQEEYLAQRELSVHLHIHLNEQFFFADPSVTQAERDRLNARNRYIPSVQDSRFVLCPRGRGPNSIRFFETLASANVPIFIGEPETKFPLDWIIDWDLACIRIDGRTLADGSYADALDHILELPLAEVNRRRRYIFSIYHQLLAPERLPVFEHLVLLRARSLLADAGARSSVTAGTGTGPRAVP